MTNLGLQSLGYTQLTSLAGASLLGALVGGIPAGTEQVLVQAEAQNVRYRDDGTAPTAAVGMLLVVNTVYTLSVAQLGVAKVIEAAASAKLNVTFYGHRS